MPSEAIHFSLRMKATNPARLSQYCIVLTDQRGGKMTKSHAATPGSGPAAVSTVKIEGSCNARTRDQIESKVSHLHAAPNPVVRASPREHAWLRLVFALTR